MTECKHLIGEEVCDSCLEKQAEKEEAALYPPEKLKNKPFPTAWQFRKEQLQAMFGEGTYAYKAVMNEIWRVWDGGKPKLAHHTQDDVMRAALAYGVERAKQGKDPAKDSFDYTRRAVRTAFTKQNRDESLTVYRKSNKGEECPVCGGSGKSDISGSTESSFIPCEACKGTGYIGSSRPVVEAMPVTLFDDISTKNVRPKAGGVIAMTYTGDEEHPTGWEPVAEPTMFLESSPEALYCQELADRYQDRIAIECAMRKYEGTEIATIARSIGISRQEVYRKLDKLQHYMTDELRAKFGEFKVGAKIYFRHNKK